LLDGDVCVVDLMIYLLHGAHVPDVAEGHLAGFLVGSLNTLE
jgi:hypothetical protein